MLELFCIAHSFKPTASENGQRKAVQFALSGIFLTTQRFFCPAAGVYFVTQPM